LKRREVTDLISEELRRMDADDVFERTVKTFLRGEAGAPKASRAASRAKASRADESRADESRAQPKTMKKD